MRPAEPVIRTCWDFMRSLYSRAGVLPSGHVSFRGSSMNRRAFLAASAASGVSPLVSPGKDNAMLPIVDTHQHLWDLSKFRLAWFDPNTPEGTILGYNFTPTEYAAATKGLNVVKAVYMEVDVVPEQQQKEADYIVELCKSGKTPTCAAVVSGRPNSDKFAEYAKQFKGHKYVKGIRQV